MLGQDDETRRGFQSDFSVSDARRAFGWLNLRPAVNGTVAVFDHDVLGNKIVPTGAWSSSMSASASFYGTFAPKLGALEAFRHVIFPNASLFYSPEFRSLIVDTPTGRRERFESFGGIGVSGAKQFLDELRARPAAPGEAQAQGPGPAHRQPARLEHEQLVRLPVARAQPAASIAADRLLGHAPAAAVSQCDDELHDRRLRAPPLARAHLLPRAQPVEHGRAPDGRARPRDRAEHEPGRGVPRQLERLADLLVLGWILDGLLRRGEQGAGRAHATRMRCSAIR